jgi:hypothetical protein
MGYKGNLSHNPFDTLWYPPINTIKRDLPLIKWVIVKSSEDYSRVPEIKQKNPFF